MPGIVQAQLLGGFGNQTHQYVAARAYAEQIDAKFECPNWTGREIFGLNDAFPSRSDLPVVNDGCAGTPPTVEWGQRDIVLGGYFQMQKWIDFLSRTQLKQWLRIQPRWLSLIPRATSLSWYAAAHMRQGDYIGWGMFANIAEPSYEAACDEHGIPRDKLIWVKQNTPRLIAGVPAELSFLPDFLTLVQADVLLRANSTFSWWAAVLGNGEVYAPVVEDHVGWYDARFVKGNWPRCADRARTGVQIDDLHLRP